MTNRRFEDNTFKDKDKLNRKGQALKISEIIKRSDEYSREKEGLVIALNSPWGTGKTMFLRMWENEIKNSTIENSFPLLDSNTNVLYYNAWDNDDFDNALIPLIDCFNSAFKSILLKESLVGVKKNVIKKTAKKFGLLAVKSAAIIGKNLIKKKLGSDIIDDFNEILDLKDNDFMEYIKVEEWLEDNEIKLEDLELDEQKKVFKKNFDDSAKKSYEKIKKAMDLSVSKEFEALKTLKKDFRKTLSVLGGEQKLVVFLDELDRCRPLYAIETLEVIKHFFSVPNVVFVLAVDIEQLSHSIATVYGQNMDAEGYLMRFVDLQLKLPNPSIDEFCNFLNTKKEQGETYFNEKQIEAIINIFKEHNLSLRDMEKVFLNIRLVMDSIGEYLKKNVFNMYLVLIVLKYKDSEFYEQIFTSEDLENYNGKKEKSKEYIDPLLKLNKNIQIIKNLSDSNKRQLYNFRSSLLPRFTNTVEDDIENNIHDVVENFKKSKIYIAPLDLCDEKVDNLTYYQYVERKLELMNMNI